MHPGGDFIAETQQRQAAADQWRAVEQKGDAAPARTAVPVGLDAVVEPEVEVRMLIVYDLMAFWVVFQRPDSSVRWGRS